MALICWFNKGGNILWNAQWKRIRQNAHALMNPVVEKGDAVSAWYTTEAKKSYQGVSLQKKANVPMTALIEGL